ncbi:MAG: hypothetical protein EOO88_34015 [Pedobacter sp.]|nr:MAG: hypothetical protein EOO88_34015 [Pedobacter sp.]
MTRRFKQVNDNKKKPTSFARLACAIAALCVVQNCWAAEFKWPQKYKAAVSLSYDDALDSQLDNAVPSLNKFKIKGTFYLVAASSTLAPRLEAWRKVAQQGHELGNHTLFHQCSKSAPGRDFVLAKNDLDKISLDQMVDQDSEVFFFVFRHFTNRHPQLPVSEGLLHTFRAGLKIDCIQ